MTSSIKPEVHNISLHRQRRTEQRPCTKNFVKIGHVRQFGRYDRGQTDTLITILHCPIGGGIILRHVDSCPQWIFGYVDEIDNTIRYEMLFANNVVFARRVLETCRQTNRQTYRDTDRETQTDKL